MKRRSFLKTAAATAAVATTASTQAAGDEKVYKWKMVTTWPKNFPSVGTAAEFLAKKINELSQGQIEVTVYGAGELVPAFEVLDAVSSGTAQIGHGSSNYWKGKSASTQFFSMVPFGMTAEEQNSWIYHGGGLKLWQEAYKPFNVIPFPGGNSGTQMGGWFNKEINSLDDLKGLKIRIGGIGADVMKKLGATPVSIPGGEVFTSLQSGVIDAAEWVGPYIDLASGLYKVAKNYYYPGWQEPGAMIEVSINKDAFDELPPHLQAIVEDATRIANQEMLSESSAQNAEALETLVREHDVQLKALPDDVLKALKKLSEEMAAEVAKKDPMAQKVYDSYAKFREKSIKYAEISSRSYLNARAL